MVVVPEGVHSHQPRAEWQPVPRVHDVLHDDCLVLVDLGESGDVPHGGPGAFGRGVGQHFAEQVGLRVGAFAALGYRVIRAFRAGPQDVRTREAPRVDL